MASLALPAGILTLGSVLLPAAAPAAAQPPPPPCDAGTLDMSGSWNQISPAMSGTWTATLTVSSSDSVSGSILSVTGSGLNFNGSPITGSIDCSTGTLTMQFPSVTLGTGGQPSVIVTAVGTLTAGANQLSVQGGQWNDSYQGVNYSGGWSGASTLLTPEVSVLPPPALPSSGATATYTVDVTGTGGSPTGTVQLTDGTDQGTCAPLVQDAAPESATTCTIGPESAGSSYDVTATFDSDGQTPYASGVSGSVTVDSAQSTGSGSPPVASTTDGLTVQGGTTGSAGDTITASDYGSDPEGVLSGGSDYFDVSLYNAASTGNATSFGSLLLTYCNSSIDAQNVPGLWWWNGSSWATVTDAAGQGPAFGPPDCEQITLSAASTPSLSQLTGTVFGVTPAQGFASTDTTTVEGQSALDFDVRVLGTPTSLKCRGRLPAGVVFEYEGGGLGSLTGTPRANTGGVYDVTLVATYGRGSTATTVNQAFTLFDLQAPRFDSSHSDMIHVGRTIDFLVRTLYAFPQAALTVTGLPAGLTFTDQGDGTGDITGTLAAGTEGTYHLVATAANGVGSPVSLGITFVIVS